MIFFKKTKYYTELDKNSNLIFGIHEFIPNFIS